MSLSKNTASILLSITYIIYLHMLYFTHYMYIHTYIYIYSTELTFGVGCVEGFVCLDKNVPRLEGDHHHFLQESIRELSLEVHVLLGVGIFTKVTWRNLKPVC